MNYSHTFDKNISRDKLISALRKKGYTILKENSSLIEAQRGSIFATFYTWKIEKFKTHLSVDLGKRTTFAYKIKPLFGYETPGDKKTLIKEINEIMGVDGHLEAKVPIESKGLIAVTSGGAWVQVGLATLSFFVVPFIATIVIIFASISLFQVIRYSKDKKTVAILVTAIILAIISKVLNAVLV